MGLHLGDGGVAGDLHGVDAADHRNVLLRDGNLVDLGEVLIGKALVVLGEAAAGAGAQRIGRASCRERV